MPETVTYQLDGAVATITLNRPEARNALNHTAKRGLLDALRQAAEDSDVRVVVLTGNGRAFCSGQDLKEHITGLTARESVGDMVRDEFNPVIETVAGMAKPVVAAVNGVAAGAGACLVFACDYRLAARSAKVTMAFAAIGLGPDSGASWTLPRLVGQARAAELLMLSDVITAEQAAGYGIFNKVVDDEFLAAETEALAGRLADGPTLAYAAIKKALAYGASHTLGEALEKEAELQNALGETEDHRNASQSFLNKEEPVFEGN